MPQLPESVHSPSGAISLNRLRLPKVYNKTPGPEIMQSTQTRCPKRANERANEQTNGRTSKQANEQMSKQASKQPSEPTSGSSSEQPGKQVFRLIQELGSRKLAIVSFIYQNAPVVISIKKFSSKLNIPDSSLRRHLSELKDSDYISSRAYHKGDLRGTEFGINHIRCRPILQYLAGEQPTGQEIEQPFRRANEQASERACPSLDRQIEDNSICQKEAAPPPLFAALQSISDSDFAMRWPKLHAFDFKANSLRRVISERKKFGVPFYDLLDSLNRIEFALNKGPVLRKNGEQVKSPGHFYNALLNGPYKRPEGYISQQEQEEIDAIAELKRIQELKAEREKLEFKIWMSDLSPDQRQEILKNHKFGPEEVTLKNFWKKEAGVVAPASQTPSS